MNYITYCRVSTEEQGASGLGIEAQQSAIQTYLNGRVPLNEFIEIESGRNDRNRPVLQLALSQCRATGATLLVSKLDRLSRDTYFITQLQKDGFSFVATDMPSADTFMTQIYAAVAQQERKMISERTKAALQAAKARGVKLGGNRGKITKEQQMKASKAGALAKTIKADAFSLKVLPTIVGLRKQGLSLGKIASVLNSPEIHILTATGKAGKWTSQAVKNVLSRNLGIL